MTNRIMHRSFWNPAGNFFSFGPLWEDLCQVTAQTETERRIRPAMDVTENEDVVKVTAELPGLSKEDVNVSIEDGVLTLSGEKNAATEKEDANYHIVERRYGSFSRTLELPAAVEADKAKATFENGVLTISLPKQEQVKPRRLEID